MFKKQDAIHVLVVLLTKKLIGWRSLMTLGAHALKNNFLVSSADLKHNTNL